MKIGKRNDAISQIMGTVLLLLVGLAIMSLVYSYVLSYPPPTPTPQVEIVGSVYERERFMTSLGKYQEDCRILLRHNGGEPLPLDLLISVNVGDISFNSTIGDFLNNSYKTDSFWNIGEQLIFLVEDITNYHVRSQVIDPVSDSILYTAEIQEETLVTTQKPFNVKHNGSTLTMDFDFKEHISGRVRFAYKKQSEENWTFTPWKPDSGRDFYHFRVQTLDSSTNYSYKTQLEYDSKIVNGKTKLFTTLENP